MYEIIPTWKTCHVEPIARQKLFLRHVKCFHGLSCIVENRQSHLTFVLKLIDELDSGIIDHWIWVDFNAEFDKVNIHYTVDEKITCVASPEFVQGIGDIEAVFPRNQQRVAVGSGFHISSYATYGIADLDLSRSAQTKQEK